jgi:uncharacterized protein (DUF2062 family)
MAFWRSLQVRLRKYARIIVRSNDSPKQIAGGVAIGTFASFNPTVISQSALVIIISTIFRCSRIPAVIMCFLSNPLTAVPMYGSAYMVGVWIVRPFGFKTLALEDVLHLFTKPDEPGLWDAVRYKAAEIASLGWAGLVPMEVGATVVGAAAGAVMYYVTLKAVRVHRLRKAERMALRARERLSRVLHERSLSRTKVPQESPDE